MSSKTLKVLATLSYYPRLLLDSILFFFIKNDYSLLDKFKNEDCLIVGNGPSLNKTDLERINMPSIGMNKINMLFSRSNWRPDLIVCINGLVIQQNSDYFNSTEIPLVLPIKAWYLGVNKRPNVIFVKISDSFLFRDDLTKPIAKGHTVTYTCLQVAAFINVKSVNIVGVDHSFNLGASNGVKNDIEVNKGSDVNHFDPNYFKDVMWGLPDLDSSEQQFILAKKYFEAKNKPVIDYTIDGKLSIYKKGRINDLYNYW